MEFGRGWREISATTAELDARIDAAGLKNERFTPARGLCEHAFVSAGASPYTLLRRALDRGLLFQAEAAARECKHVRLDDSLALLRLYAQEAHPRFDAAAVRWLGRLMAEHPGMGLDRATLALDAIRGLAGTSSEVARSRLALILRQIGEEKSAGVLERA